MPLLASVATAPRSTAGRALEELLPGFRGVCSLSYVNCITSADCARIADQAQRCQKT
jgi:hypothetical protein